jgi:hypothetical protein
MTSVKDPFQFAGDPLVDFCGQIGLVLAEEIPGDDGGPQVTGHCAGPVGVGQSGEAFLEILEIDHRSTSFESAPFHPPCSSFKTPAPKRSESSICDCNSSQLSRFDSGLRIG